MHDIGRRYVVRLNGFPIESDDDEDVARRRMRERVEAQARSLESHFPFKTVDRKGLAKLWDIVDMGAQRTSVVPERDLKVG